MTRALESNVHGIGVGTAESHSPNRENVGRSGGVVTFHPSHLNQKVCSGTLPGVASGSQEQDET